MADIHIKDLLRSLKEGSFWGGDVPPALYIRFANTDVERVESKSFETVGGGSVVIDIKGGKVVGIEIA